MTAVRRADGVIRVGSLPSRPERTALVEARGALLAWDVLGDPVPAVEIHDAEQAAEWLWEVYGPTAAAAILGDVTEVELALLGGSVEALAWLRWAQAWWPASTIGGIPALDPALLAAEIAVHTAAVEHLLDDDEAVTRALANVTAPAGNVSAEVLALYEQVETIAEDFGVTVSPAAAKRRVEWALAAGEAPSRDGLRLRSGATAVDWSLVPAGVLDAVAPVWWEVRRTAGATVLSVSVEAAPAAKPVDLLARCGPDLEVPLYPDGGAFVGASDVDATWLSEDIAPVVFAPRFADADRIGAPVDIATQTAVIALARTRLTSPAASLTEREAGRR
ncbi:hypothetical protein SAMN05216553_10524 [Lentzea fradiae]|uniref:Uncharacterized protein n=1 Tax=Lentzea fradiae TaxID=200378 RepID=A0A1G7R229_9PSEU|nr:hypothetical protein [Lentzea fradiae]SDG04010.1 hypothetical protein SAMN05216553_10524 [Lentzea fradiae]